MIKTIKKIFHIHKYADLGNINFHGGKGVYKKRKHLFSGMYVPLEICVDCGKIRVTKGFNKK